MSTPVVTSKWAGNFDCTVCRRKRLMAEEFSKSSLEKHKKTGQALRCKQCTAKQEQEKRAAAREKSGDSAAEDSNETRKCAGPCQAICKNDAYNRNQWQKGEGKSRCRSCVENAVKEETAQQNKSKDSKLEQARLKVANLKLDKKSTAQQIVAAESELAALEAEKVTGLKPIKLGGRGRGTRRYGGGRGGGRGRTGTRK
uniref:Stc1 domain-containing protein n=1 Tax=Pseudo-nitzschia delicatissima TaxID=44447 RepID=A0A7S0UF16_9STRA|mmetsp:Transcript_1666/g.3481  ORF Transcript_1666/g.3481 Transcript_1666/m.3481 type:complete len:199 (+) Transcript_1666:129-725(+)